MGALTSRLAGSDNTGSDESMIGDSQDTFSSSTPATRMGPYGGKKGRKTRRTKKGGKRHKTGKARRA